MAKVKEARGDLLRRCAREDPDFTSNDKIIFCKPCDKERMNRQYNRKVMNSVERLVKRRHSVVTKVFPLTRGTQTDSEPPPVTVYYENVGVQANIPKAVTEKLKRDEQSTQNPDFRPSLVQVLLLLTVPFVSVMLSYFLYRELHVVKRFEPTLKTQDCCLCRMASSVLGLLKQLVHGFGK